MTRRRAFTIAAQGLGGVAGAAIILPAVGFAVAPIFHRGKERWEAVGPVGDFVEDTYRQVVFTETEGIGDAGKTTAYVRKSSKRARRRTRASSSPSPTAAPTSAARSASSRRPATSSAPATAASTTSRASGSAARRCARSTSSRPGSATARSRSARATASPPSWSRSAPATPASSPAGSGNTSTRRGPLPSRRPDAEDSTEDPRLRRPRAAAQTGQAGRGRRRQGPGPGRPQDLAAGAPDRTCERLGDQAKEAPGRRARLGRPAHRRQRLPHRDALPQGAEGDQLVLHARLGDPLRLHRPGRHRRLPGDVLHALDDPGLRLDRPHQQRRPARPARPRDAQVGRRA